MTMEAFGEQSFGDESGSGASENLEPGWLSEEELAETRGRVPLLYVEAVPVRMDPDGQITSVGLLLRASRSGAITRTLVSGRVMFGERVRDALMRHLEKDLGPVAFPVLPLSVVPHAVAEYFPWPGGRLHDPRQHAVSLVYAVPVSGECQPRQDALELTWMTPAEAAADDVVAEMEGGRGALLRQVLQQLGAL
ncbi:MAG: DUF4916 domain-containing protein [Nocardioides sp.]|uniref:DUF4916 domain-containing protein n=1 Tax=Nocardioides sp. TaxID=35761 RepID=UPI0039E542A5